jgi:hypothetical protein
MPPKVGRCVWPSLLSVLHAGSHPYTMSPSSHTASFTDTVPYSTLTLHHNVFSLLLTVLRFLPVLLVSISPELHSFYPTPIATLYGCGPHPTHLLSLVPRYAVLACNCRNPEELERCRSG